MCRLKVLNISSYVANFTDKVEPNFISLSATNQVLILLYGSQTNNPDSLNQEILKYVISYLKATTRFDRPLIDFQPKKIVFYFRFLQDVFPL